MRVVELTDGAKLVLANLDEDVGPLPNHLSRGCLPTTTMTSLVGRLEAVFAELS
jgi:hypothetical protein